MYSNLAEGKGEFITAAWLPATHEEYLRPLGIDPEDPFLLRRLLRGKSRWVCNFVILASEF